MSSSTKSLTYRIGADLKGLRRELEDSTKATRKPMQELALLERRQREHRQTISDLGKGMMTFGAVAAVGMGLAVNAAIKWESAFAGVRKTVNGSDSEISALEGELRGLARTLPATHEQIAAVAEAAGQLGIKRQDIAAFTHTMIDLGETTNLTAEEAATALAKFSNIMGTSASDVDRLGSALVALGNDGASTEKDIIDMGLRIAGAGHQIGLSESDVLSFASALSSVGIEAEAGGSSFSRVMVDMATAVEENSDKLKTFAQVAGMSADDFAAAFRDDAAGAINKFIGGLGQLQASGADVFGTLAELGFTEIRVRDTLLRAAGASDMFTSSLKVGSSAWAENTALAAEAAKRYQTTEAKMQVAANNIKDAAIDVGAAILPALQGGVEFVRNLVVAFQTLPGPLKTVVAVLGSVAAGVALLGGASMVMGPKIMKFRENMTGMIAQGGKMSGALGKAGLFMAGPWGLAIGAGVAILGAFAAKSGAAAEEQQQMAAAAKEVAQIIAEQNGVVNESVIAAEAKQLADDGVLKMAKDLGIEGGKVTDAVLGQGDAYDQLVKQLSAKAEINGGELNDEGKLLAAIVGKKEALDLANEATRDGKDAAEGATKANKGHAQSQEQIKKAAEEAADALQSMIKELDRLNGTTLSTREAQRQLADAVAAVDGAIKDNGTTLDQHTQKGRDNAATLDAIASAANDAAQAASAEAEANGTAADGAAAMNISLTASRDLLFQQALRFYHSKDAAWAYVDSVLAIPDDAVTQVSTPGSKTAKSELLDIFKKVKDIPPSKSVNVGVLSAEAIAKLKAMGFQVRTLPDGTVVVRANTAPAKDALDRFIGNNYGRQIAIRVVTTYQSIVPQVGGKYYVAQGGIVRSYASGGVENHAPMIARARPGTVRVWAEPDTDAESYIPWAMDRRQRATGVLADTANGFGYMLVPKSSLVRSYAYGGVAGGSAAAANHLAGCEVRVYVGNQEIKDIARVEIRERERQVTRAVKTGAGRAR